MQVIYHPEAESELLNSAIYYEEKSSGLGSKFLSSHNDAIEDIVSFPDAWPILDDDLRRHQLNHFPYGIIYRIESDTIKVLALMHLHREPGYWKNRL